MPLPTLDEFIARSQSRNFSNNGYVRFKGFSSLYVRCNQRYINHQYHKKVIDIANLQAKNPGNGAFKKLVAHLRRDYPDHIIHVENVLTERFREGLVRMGFEETSTPMCFWIPPQGDNS